MRPSNKIPSDTYWRVQLVLWKFGLTIPQNCHRNTIASRRFWQNNAGHVWPTNLGVTWILRSSRLVLGKEIAESSRSEFLEKCFTNSFALSETKHNTSGPLNKGGIVDLPLLRKLLAICLKLREISFLEVMTKDCCGMVDWRTTLSLISSRDHCQRFSPS